MMEARHGAPPSETTRLAIVMNGGVSLAVWMGGVTHEINRLIERKGLPPTSAAWRRILGYDELSTSGRTLPRHRVLVDHVAGTSAGGLNGALLATAIARGADLPELSRLWRDKGRLSRDCLLPGGPEQSGAGDRADGSDGRSILDGSFFADAIGKEVRDLFATKPDGEAVSLHVTATAMSGGSLSVEDAMGAELAATDHRRVYRFTSSRDDVGDFDNIDDLVQAARASASFPTAFCPVLETPGLRERSTRPVTATTGKDGREQPVWLMDGGVLDNAPFEPLLETIIATPRADVGDRWIVYVVPSSAPRSPTMRDTTGSFADGSPPRAPGWDEVVGAMLGIKNEVDLRGDVESMRRFAAAGRAAYQRPEQLIDHDLTVSSDLFRLYLTSRATGLLHYVEESKSTKVRLRALRIEPSDVQEVLGLDLTVIPSGLAAARDGAWQWGGVVARRLALTLSRNARRAGLSDEVVSTLAALEHELAVALEPVAAAYGAPSRHRWGFRRILQTADTELRTTYVTVAEIMGRAVTTWAQASGVPVEAAWSRLLGVEVLTNFAEWHANPAPPEFETLLVDPGSRRAGYFVFGDEDPFAEELAGRPDVKLYGTRLGHFGAFGCARHREHDWLWGRIDAAMCLASALVPRTEGSGDLANGLRRDLLEEILVEEKVGLDELRERTRRVHRMTNGAFLLELLDSGEIEVENLIESLEHALSTLGEGHRWHPIVDAAAHALGGVAEGISDVVEVRTRVERWIEQLREHRRDGDALG